MKFTSIIVLLGSTQAIRSDKVIENLPPFSGWGAHLNGLPGTVNEFGNYFAPYNRDIPVRFTGDVALDSYPVDKFTQNMLTKYAIEGIDNKNAKDGADPVPNGKFYLTKDSARKAAAEVVCTHFALCKDEGENFLNLRYDDAWNYYDVNKVGRIDAVGVSQFFRYLTRPLGAIDL